MLVLTTPATGWTLPLGYAAFNTRPRRCVVPQSTVVSTVLMSTHTPLTAHPRTWAQEVCRM